VVARGQLLLAVSPVSSFHSVPELIAYAKANPGKLLNASSSMDRLAMSAASCSSS